MSTDFQGEKILLSSERLIFNTTTDNIEFTAKKIFHISAGDSVRIDIGSLGSTNSDNLFVINAPRVQFGIATKGREVEPVVKGKTLAAVLKDLMTAITNYSDAVAASVPDAQSILQLYSTKLRQDFKLIQLDLESPGVVQSDITYTI
jgi:hypothetical protein